ncbi:MAG: hypothetical protein O3C13_01245 [Bacteroidetes bacterium]|nr:hypothetical protein [Bacteroidota bacterium]MDA0984654.1 hypothetical protein [Bacteroidota bacterium]
MMLKIFPQTNIEIALEKTQNKANIKSKQDCPLDSIFSEVTIKSQNNFVFDLLETNKIFHINQIKDVCIDYRLRFLDLKYFKGDLPESAENAIKQLERSHDTVLTDFKIMAPSILFRLAKQDDPLLFVPMGNEYYYLVHKWGNDLHPFRKLFMWPYRNIWNLLLTLLGVSWIITAFTPMAIFTKSPDATSYWMLFFFMFKALASIVLFYGFALGKNFNPAIWNNKYNKS